MFVKHSLHVDVLNMVSQCKAKIVTGLAQICRQTDGQTDGQIDGFLNNTLSFIHGGYNKYILKMSISSPNGKGRCPQFEQISTKNDLCEILVETEHGSFLTSFVEIGQVEKLH